MEVTELAVVRHSTHWAQTVYPLPLPVGGSRLMEVSEKGDRAAQSDRSDAADGCTDIPLPLSVSV